MSKMIDNRTTQSGEPLFSSFIHSKGRKLGLPISGTFELTSRCNFDCKMCYVHSSECNALKESEISAEKWIELGREARDAGMIFLLLTGGEPLIRKDFPKIYKALNELGLIISINTNASLIDDEIIELFSQYVPHRVNISLYGGSGETYRNLCVNDSFEKVLGNIKRLREIGVAVKINSSITPYNFSDAELIYDITKRLDLQIKTTSYLYPPLRFGESNTGVNSGRFSAKEAAYAKIKCDLLRYGREEFLNRAERLKNGISLSDDECLEPVEEGTGIRCRAGVTSFWVNWKGDMSACGIIPDNEFNVFEKGFDFCWQSIREKTGKIRLPKECVSCKYKDICCVCAASCLCETGSYSEKPEYVCEYTKNIVTYTEIEAERLKGE